MKISIADEVFDAVLETDRSPATCAGFRAALPFESRIVHLRWSGESAWLFSLPASPSSPAWRALAEVRSRAD